jgi:hypothetical protein
MEEQQVSPSVPTQIQNQYTGPINPEMLEVLKAEARARAMQVTGTNQNTMPTTEKIVYVDRYIRRNLTVAELILVFLITCGGVLGLQGAWFFINHMPSIEIKWNK